MVHCECGRFIGSAGYAIYRLNKCQELMVKASNYIRSWAEASICFGKWYVRRCTWGWLFAFGVMLMIRFIHSTRKGWVPEPNTYSYCLNIKSATVILHEPFTPTTASNFFSGIPAAASHKRNSSSPALAKKKVCKCLNGLFKINNSIQLK